MGVLTRAPRPQGIRRVVYAEEYATDAHAGALMHQAGISLASVTEEVLAFRWLDLHGRDGEAAAGQQDEPASAPAPAAAAAASGSASMADGAAGAQ